MVALIAVATIISILVITRTNGDRILGLRVSGSLADNLSDFKNGISEAANINSVNKIAKAYLGSVTYEITDVDKDNLVKALKSDNMHYNKTTCQLNIEKVDDSYKLVQSEEWNNAIRKNLDEMYEEYIKNLIGGIANEMPK